MRIATGTGFQLLENRKQRKEKYRSKGLSIAAIVTEFFLPPAPPNIRLQIVSQPQQAAEFIVLFPD